MADIIDMPCIIRVGMPIFWASIRRVMWVVAMKGSPGTRNIVFPVWAA